MTLKLTIEQILQKAITAHQDGSLEEAERFYQQVLKAQPKNLDANNNIGVLLFSLGRLDEAEAIFKKIIEIKSDFSEAHFNLGKILDKLNRLDEAVLSFKKVIEFKPDYLEAHNNLALVLSKLNKFTESASSYKKVIELKPDYVDAHSNLGVILNKLGNLEEAEVSFKKAITFKPEFVEAHNNLGVTLKDLGRFDEAKISYEKVVKLKPNYAPAHNNLGNIYFKLNKLEESEMCFDKALKLKPDYTDALINKGHCLFNKGEFVNALKIFDSDSSADSRSRSLYCLYALGRIEDIYKQIEVNAELDDEDIAVAAFSAFISKKENKVTAHKFCNNPLDFIKVSNLSSHFKDVNPFISETIDELHKTKTSWEPIGKTTKKGFQSIKNIFDNPPENIQKLKSIVINEIDSYYSKFKNEPCSFIKKWPSKENLYAWHVILKQQGHQNPHIHTGGWLSGVIYLKVVPTLDKNEGAIQFSLNGEHYFDDNSPKKIHEPQVGDIVLFPSSLHHRTIPFTTDTDRIIVSFDFKPIIKKNYT